jgi:uncharacterized protein YbaR (Trm112 family)
MNMVVVNIKDGLMTECVCPECGVIYDKFVPLAHYDNPFAWRRAGFLVITCPDCNKRLAKVHKKLMLEDRWFRTVDGIVYGE